MQYLDELDENAAKVGAVNVIRVSANGKLGGFNTDYYGFRDSLLPFMAGEKIDSALILGTGGASHAVTAVLNDLGIDFKFVSRSVGENKITYDQLKQSDLSLYPLIVNTTPLGMTPDVDTTPELNYHQLSNIHFLYDLVYNPAETLFLKKGKESGAKIKNGLEMLYIQADRSWEIWNNGF